MKILLFFIVFASFAVAQNKRDSIAIVDTVWYKGISTMAPASDSHVVFTPLGIAERRSAHLWVEREGCDRFYWGPNPYGNIKEYSRICTICARWELVHYESLPANISNQYYHAMEMAKESMEGRK